MGIINDYYGRLLTRADVASDVMVFAEQVPALVALKSNLVCQRCGQIVDKEAKLPTGAYYCRSCLVFGRLTSDDVLYYFPQQPFEKQDCLVWQGQLTTYQQEVSDGLLKGLAGKENMLVHAVTGAGKTEMIYQVIAQVINNGGAVAVASPRIDVCIELSKRLHRDFRCDISLLHGGSEPYKRSPLVIATTHQLLRFRQAFDLVIIDEVDAFPFVDNAMLYHAVENAAKPDGVKVYLTATSTDFLERQVRLGKLTKLELSRRFHANPLVVPRPVWLGNFKKRFAKQRLPKKLVTYISRQRATGYPLLIFYPNIEEGEVLADILARTFPKESIDFVSSQTENRLELVEQFRDRKLSMLVSTTILERGVTFPCVDVFVIESHHRLYTKSALVQISGRVGRASERPIGDLIFFHAGETTAIRKAIREIKEMNRKGGF